MSPRTRRAPLTAGLDFIHWCVMGNPRVKDGAQWESGGHRPLRDDLVSWPKEALLLEQPATPKPSTATASGEDVHAELARAKSEVDRLLARVRDLAEENERLHRAARPQPPR